jgi:CBS domain-containing protein
MKVVDAMRKEIVVVDENLSIHDAAIKMRDQKQGCAVVLSKSSPIGIVTERDITWKVVGEAMDSMKHPVSCFMSTPLITIDPDANILEAAKLLKEHHIRRLVVAKKEILYGVLTASDIARNLEGYMDSEIKKILKYSFSPFGR